MPGFILLGLLFGALEAVAQGLPTVTITSADSASAEAGADTASFTITRVGGNTAAQLTVGISISGSAALNVDYTLSPAFVTAATIAAGETSRIVLLTPLADNRLEGVETATVMLTANPSAYALGGSTSVDLDIADDPVEVNIGSVDENSAEAGADTASFTITRVGGNTAAQLTVGISISGSAALNVDYTLSPAFVTAATIAAGETSRTVVLTPLADNLVEGSETATVALTANPSTYALGGSTSVDLAIADDAVQVSISSSDRLASETNGDPASFTVSRSGGNTAAPLTVGISIGGTAALNVDYTLSPAFVTAATIAGGETSRTVVLTPLTPGMDEPEDEGRESITIGLTFSGSYEIEAPGCVTLLLDDSLALYEDGFEPLVTFPCDD